MITAPDNRKYIGKTTESLEVIWKEHIKTCRKDYKGECRVLNNAIKKYGHKHFKVEILEECEKEYLDNKEIEYIKKHNTQVPRGMNVKEINIEESKNDKEEISMEEIQKYITKVQNGYIISNHPMGPEKKFISKNKTDIEKYNKAIKYLKKLNSLTEPIVIEENKEKSENEKYILKHRNGYRVKYPNQKIKYFVSRIIPLETLYENALSYVNELKSQECSSTTK